MLVLGLDHVKHCLKYEYILLLHFLNLKFETSGKFCAVLELRELNDLSRHDVDPEAPWLVHDFLLSDLFTFKLAQLGHGI